MAGCELPDSPAHRLKDVSTAWITVPIKAWQSGFTVMHRCGRKGKQPLLTKDSKRPQKHGKIKNNWWIATVCQGFLSKSGPSLNRFANWTVAQSARKEIPASSSQYSPKSHRQPRKTCFSTTDISSFVHLPARPKLVLPY